MSNTQRIQLTEPEKVEIRNSARQAEESVAIILRIANRRSATPGDLSFPIRSLKGSLEILASRAKVDL